MLSRAPSVPARCPHRQAFFREVEFQLGQLVPASKSPWIRFFAFPGFDPFARDFVRGRGLEIGLQRAKMPRRYGLLPGPETPASG